MSFPMTKSNEFNGACSLTTLKEIKLCENKLMQAS